MNLCNVSVNRVLGFCLHSDSAVQAGTPMTATWNGTSFRIPERGVFILRPKVSRGPGQRPGIDATGRGLA